MFVSNYQTELQHSLARAAKLLQGPALPLWLEWELEQSLRQKLTLELRSGLDREPAVMQWTRGTRGHELVTGMERYRWQTAEGTVRVVRVAMPCGHGAPNDFWAVRAADYRRFYRFVRRHVRRQTAQQAPVMAADQQKRLWDNTVGFLRRGDGLLARYGVLPKRGVLLLGEPGNGKTMACRWLAAECRRRALEWRSVTAEMYEEARADREVPTLFQLDSPGVILFDDFDAALRNREEHREADKQATFLAELDGVDRKTGVVYLFTSNAKLDQIDPAMRRPGRLDVIVHFPRPEAALRHRVIAQRWHADILAAIDLQRIVAETDGYSFAEIEEARKLLVLHHLDTGRWEWDEVGRAMRDRRRACTTRRVIGFSAVVAGNGDHALSARAK